MSSGATFTEVRLGIMGGYIHPVRWQIVDTRQAALLLILYFAFAQKLTEQLGTLKMN